jgi:succinate dehydrogenase / fumarate reductase flavoprotein subunit
VFGKISGESAARFALRESRSEPEPDRRRSLLSDLEQMKGIDGPPAAEVRHRIKELLSRVASVIRSPEQLSGGLAEVAEMRACGLAVDGHGLTFCVETRNMLEVAEIVLLAASSRRESRGPHLYFARADDQEPQPRDDETGRRYVSIRRGPNGRAIAAWVDPIRRPEA